MDLNELQVSSHANARAKGFHDAADRLKALAETVRLEDPEVADLMIASYYSNRLMLIVGEVVEAHEELRHGHAMDEAYEVNGKPEGVPSELSDATIRIAELSGEINISLSDHIQNKAQYNAGRERLHGGKGF